MMGTTVLEIGVGETVVVIDLEWVVIRFGQRLEELMLPKQAFIERLRAAAPAMAELDANVRVVCFDAARDAHRESVHNALASAGYELILGRVVRRNSRFGPQDVQKGVDVALSVYVVNAIRDGLKHLVLLSGDTDFEPLVRDAVRRGTKVTLYFNGLPNEALVLVATAAYALP